MIRNDDPAARRCIDKFPYAGIIDYESARVFFHSSREMIIKISHPYLHLACLLSVSPSWDVAAQQRDPVAGSNIDVRAAIERTQLKEGQNVVYRNGKTTLVAHVKDGKVVGWAATNSTGKAISVSERSAPHSSKRPCLVCPIDESTPPIAEVCYEIPCDKLPKRNAALSSEYDDNHLARSDLENQWCQERAEMEQ